MQNKMTMSNLSRYKSDNNFPPYYLSLFRKTTFIFILLISTPLLAQEEILGKTGIQAGLNNGMLSNGFGPSFSVHYAIRHEKVVQLESQFFFDYSGGKTFLSGHAQKNFGMGIAAGPRINFRPKKDWNPSVFLMPGMMYSSKTSSRYDDVGSSGLSPAVSLGISNDWYRKHMVSFGFNVGENIFAANLKYGYWF